MTISALYSFIAEKKLAGFFLPDVPVVGSYGSIAAGKAGKSSGSFNGKAGVTDNGKGKNRGAAASSAADATSLQKSSAALQASSVPSYKVGNLIDCPPEWLRTCDGMSNDAKLVKYRGDIDRLRPFLVKNQFPAEKYFWKIDLEDYPDCPKGPFGPTSFFLFGFKNRLPEQFVQAMESLQDPERKLLIQSVARLMTIT